LRGQDPVLEIADARQDDAIQALRDATAGSLGAVVCVDVVEHLDLDPMLELLELAATRLRAGGVFIAQTPNPASLAVLSTSSAHDPAHTRLVHPSVLAFLCERAGFDAVELRYFAPSLDDELPLVTADGAPPWIDQINASLTKLNDVLFGPQEYAVVARVGSL
jgi:SAM-dependent methyltransferase